MLLPFTPGITGTCTLKKCLLKMELKSLRNLQVVKFKTYDQTIINTIQQGFSPILEDYLSDYLPGFSDAFLKMQSHSIPGDGEERELNITNKVKMKFCWIPHGKATLGSPVSEKERRHEREKEHDFETNGFWMARYPVTQAQWRSVMGNNPSHFNGNNLPVEKVSQDDCQQSKSL